MTEHKYFTKDEAVGIILDTLHDNPNIDPDEVYQIAFNENYYIVGNYKAKQALKHSQWGIFGAIGLIYCYEKFNYGEVTTDFSNYEKIANMLEYIIGEAVWADIQNAYYYKKGSDLNDTDGFTLDTQTQNELIEFIKLYRKTLNPSFDRDFLYLTDSHD